MPNVINGIVKTQFIDLKENVKSGGGYGEII